MFERLVLELFKTYFILLLRENISGINNYFLKWA